MRLTLTRPAEVDRAEAIRYLKSREDTAFSDDLTAAAAAVEAAAAPSAAAVCLPLVREGERLLFGSVELAGNAIARHLEGCGRCVLLGVTLGFSVDRLISAAGQTDPYRALLLDACATSAVEDLADHATERLYTELLGEQGRLTWRFSPGYGDLPLSLQPKLLALLDATRAIGLTVGGSFLLSPVKSVTALIGVADDNCAHEFPGQPRCAACSMQKTCPYRIEERS